MTDCLESKNKIYSFVIGECDLETAAAIRAHIRDCPACAEELKRMREVVRLTGKVEKVNPSHDLYREVLAQIRPRFFWLKVAGVAAAAAVLIVVVLYSLIGLPGGIPAPERERIVESGEKPEGIEVVERDNVTPKQPLEKKKPALPSPDDDGEALVRGKSGGSDEPVPLKEPIHEGEEKSLVNEPYPEQENKEKAVVKETAPTPKQQQPVTIAKVGTVVGEFRVKRKGSEDWLQGKALLSILPGDTIETNALGQVRIDFETGDYVYVNTNSRVDLADGSDELLVRIGKGEVYCEKESPEGELTVETDFGVVRSKEGRFDMKMFGASQCLLQVLSGEVNCCESEKEYTGKHGELTRTWLRRGKRCNKGTKLRSKEGFRWAVKLQPKRDDKTGKQVGKPGKQDKPGKHNPGVPPDAGRKPGGQQGKEPGGKVGPGPSPMPPPGGGQPGPGNGHGPGGKQGGMCPPSGKK